MRYLNLQIRRKNCRQRIIYSPSTVFLTPQRLLSLLTLLLLASSQAVIIRNLGCKSYNPNGVCLDCSTRYYLDSSAICQPVNPNCNTYDSRTGACLTCYPGFGIIENTCLPGIVSSNFDPNCNTFNGPVCTLCSKNYYLSGSGKCTAVNPSCNTYNPSNGDCTSCFAGYEVQAGNCVVSQSQATIANCNSIDSKTGKCLKCSYGYYFDSIGLCTQQNPNCKTFNTLLSLCIECYPGYDLKNNDCYKSTAKDVDPNCKTFNGGICSECSKGAIFNTNRVCIVIDPSCLTFDQNDGSCTSCYPGYSIANKSCIVSKQKNVTDPNCKSFVNSNVCGECSTRYYVGWDGKCQEVNPLCKTYNVVNGVCLSCYSGFTLVADTCIASVSQVTDQYCKTWNGSLCTQCSFGAFFLTNGTCAVANPLCKTFSTLNGNCLSCYDSFELRGSECVKSNQSVSDQNCAEFYQKICVKCSPGFIFLDSGLCGSVSPNCKTYSNLTGKCTSCYMGYDLVDGSCINSTTHSSIDPNCASFKDGKCVTCSKNFYFSPSGTCLAVDPLCNGYNPSTGACLGCYQSYVLKQGSCIQDKNNAYSDPNCASWLQGVCLSCASRTFMNSSGLCQNVNINCNTYNAVDGACTSCFPGFTLGRGSCQQALSPSSCSKFNKDGSCAKCGTGSYLSAGQCIAIDPQCANFDTSALLCLSCYSGYSILNGACQISKVDSKYQVENCYAYDQQNNCIKCYDRYYLSINSCQPVNVFCKTYDDNTGNCLSCYSSFTLKNGACVN